ncbi:MAG: A/G-specific adenine glycosylase [Oscillospiraceae bacterium]|nr:A/G-specific adenine glycosylase [Oscillospiraceae bacterium]
MTQQERFNAIAAPLLAWYDENKRDLPWRMEVSPYTTWISEIMLQQTRVAAVLPYYQRFLEAFPTVEVLANADEQQLLKLWEGLGYYSRARNLHKAAKEIVQRGGFPQTYADILTLSGIGEYTAGAIASIAFRQKVSAVDGNVLRIAARLGSFSDNVLDPKFRRTVRELMDEAVSAERPGAFNQALMDLSATVCLPKNPQCSECPLQPLCLAYAQGRQKELPVRISKTKKRTEELTVFLLLQDGRVALRQRPASGLLASLWEYPHTAGALDEAAAAAQLAAWGLTPHHWVKRLQFHHIFTHIRWEVTGYIVEVSGSGDTDWLWADSNERGLRPVPSAFEKLTQELTR